MKRISDEFFDAKQEVGGISNQIYEIDDLIKMVMFGDYYLDDYYLEMFACTRDPEFLRLMRIDPVLVGRDWPGIHVEESGTAIEYQQYAPRTEKRPTNR